MKTPTTATLDSELLEKVATRLKALTHPMRIAIIDLLLEKEKLTVTEIYKHCKIDQASASTHLKILKENGVLSSARDGKMRIYSVNTKTLKSIIDCVDRCNAE
ncbi:MAG: metalloregulator ArsR/SmtB family transcription factor [Bacteroidetes bacterium]|nr:metalloregulator ArsR/SmtB family transcription factor [Bacteroidota bacterium]